MTEIAHRLTVAEADVLADCEQRIEGGLKTFVEVGSALATIRDNRLYRAEFSTFEDYCQRRWGFNRHRAQQLISAVDVVTNVTAAGLPAPANEGQARELARVPEPDRADVWRETVERTEGRPTAAAIREVTQERTEPAPAIDEFAKEVADAIERHLPPDPDDPHRSWRRAFLADVHAAYRLMSRSTVEEIAERADVECVTELSRAAAELASFAERVRRAVAASTPDNVVQLMRAVR